MPHIPSTQIAQQFTFKSNAEQLACLFGKLAAAPTVPIAAQTILTLCKKRLQTKITIGTVNPVRGVDIDQTTSEINRTLNALNGLGLEFTQESVIVFPNVQYPILAPSEAAFQQFLFTRLFCNVEVLASYGTTGIGGVYVLQVRSKDLFLAQQILNAADNAEIDKIPCANVCEPSCPPGHVDCRRRSDCNFKYPCCGGCPDKDCADKKCKDKKCDHDKCKKKKEHRKCKCNKKHKEEDESSKSSNSDSSDESDSEEQ